MVVPEHVFSAAVNGRMDVLREYFASGDRDPNDVVARNGWTLLVNVGSTESVALQLARRWTSRRSKIGAAYSSRARPGMMFRLSDTGGRR